MKKGFRNTSLDIVTISLFYRSMLYMCGRIRIQSFIMHLYISIENAVSSSLQQHHLKRERKYELSYSSSWKHHHSTLQRQCLYTFHMTVSNFYVVTGSLKIIYLFSFKTLFCVVVFFTQSKILHGNGF